MTVVIASGGLDSTVLLYDFIRYGEQPVVALSVNYGQRHAIELDRAARIAEQAGVEHVVARLEIPLPSSALTGPVDVPHGHYADDSMRVTVVPNRNMMLLAAAVAVAVDRGHHTVATGIHAGDHPIYPDCRPRFVAAMNVAVAAAIDGYGDVTIVAPFVEATKTDIVRLGHNLDVPFAETWSCYDPQDMPFGQPVHCGRCGTCVERREAFRDAGITDPTLYAVGS